LRPTTIVGAKRGICYLHDSVGTCETRRKEREGSALVPPSLSPSFHLVPSPTLGMNVPSPITSRTWYLEPERFHRSIEQSLSQLSFLTQQKKQGEGRRRSGLRRRAFPLPLPPWVSLPSFQPTVRSPQPRVLQIRDMNIQTHRR